MSFTIFLLFLVTLSSLLLGLFVLAKNPKVSINISYFFVALGISLWALTNALFQLTYDHFALHFYALAAYYAGAILGVSFYYFTLVFPSGYSTLKKRCQVTLFICSIAWVVVIALPDVTLKDVAVYDSHKALITGPGLYVYFLGVVATSAGGLINLIFKYRRTSGLLRLQILYVLFGYFLLAAFGIFFNVIFPLLDNYTMVDFGPNFSLLFLAATAYAIVKHQLMGIKEVIQRGTVYTVLLALVVGMYVGTVFMLNLALNRYTHITALLSGAFVAIFGIFGVPPLEHYFRKFTDRWFYKDNYNYAAALYELSQVIKQNIELASLRVLIVEKLQSILKCEFVELQMGKESLGVAADRVALQKEIKLDHRTVATLVLGKKRSGDPYRQTDYQLLEIVANQAAVALEKGRLYEQVKNHSVELEKRVRERTERLLELQEMQSHMMVDISHALQTPLTVMKSRLDYLKKNHPEDPDIPALGRTIDEVSKRTYDLLKLATWDMKEEGFALEPLDLSELLEEIAEYLGILCNEQNIRLEVDIEPKVTVLGDRRKLEELVNNLMSNAVKYISNSREIRISLGKQGQEAVLSVKDTGIGIPKELLEKIFERFYRVQSSSWASGIGVGLAISKKIVEGHHGSITVESEVGKGSTFTIRLPLDKGRGL